MVSTSTMSSKFSHHPQPSPRPKIRRFVNCRRKGILPYILPFFKSETKNEGFDLKINYRCFTSSQMINLVQKILGRYHLTQSVPWISGITIQSINAKFYIGWLTFLLSSNSILQILSKILIIFGLNFEKNFRARTRRWNIRLFKWQKCSINHCFSF